jgi:hypothetical protein
VKDDLLESNNIPFPDPQAALDELLFLLFLLFLPHLHRQSDLLPVRLLLDPTSNALPDDTEGSLAELLLQSVFADVRTADVLARIEGGIDIDGLGGIV